MALFSFRRKSPPLAVVRDEPAPLAERALAHLPELFGLAHHLCGNDADAEDLVQETYARALDGAARFDEGGNLRAWLFRILRNGFIDRARRRNIVLEIPDEEIETVAGPPLEQLRYLTGAEVTRALAELPIEMRFVLLLDVEGFSEAEIADIVRCAPGTVKSRLSRAKTRMRALLGERHE